MTVVSLVYAQSRNGIIGADGGLPWTLPSDLKRFKDMTFGKPIIMGRKTWESLPRKPLPGRLNIVVTRRQSFIADGAVVVTSSDAALAAAGHVAEVCVIGGGEIYQMFLARANRIYLTDVDADVVGDTKALVLPVSEWREIARTLPLRGAKDSAAFTTRTLERVK
jgi:dihydrofolate reductase